MQRLPAEFPGVFIRVFSSEAAVLEAGIPAFRQFFCLFLFMSLQMASQSVAVSLGRSRQAIFFSLLRKAIINAPLTVILPCWRGVSGVFIAEAVSQLLGSGGVRDETVKQVLYRAEGFRSTLPVRSLTSKLPIFGKEVLKE